MHLNDRVRRWVRTWLPWLMLWAGWVWLVHFPAARGETTLGPLPWRFIFAATLILSVAAAFTRSGPVVRAYTGVVVAAVTRSWQFSHIWPIDGRSPTGVWLLVIAGHLLLWERMEYK